MLENPIDVRFRKLRMIHTLGCFVLSFVFFFFFFVDLFYFDSFNISDFILKLKGEWDLAVIFSLLCVLIFISFENPHYTLLYLIIQKSFPSMLYVFNLSFGDVEGTGGILKLV
jgi:hypothetical protein